MQAKKGFSNDFSFRLPLKKFHPICGRWGWKINFLLLLAVVLFSCKDSSSKITGVNPTSVVYESTTQFTISGENLSSGTQVKFASTACTDTTSNSDGTSLFVNCLAPKQGSGNKATMVISLNQITLAGGEREISLTQNFQKYGPNIQLLDDNASNWDCVYDVKTKLYWQNQTSNLNKSTDAANRFQWSNSDNSFGNTTDCKNTLSSACNTLNFVSAANTQKICGLTGWRLPSGAEIRTIISCSTGKPNVLSFFPNHQSAYWTSSSVDANNAYQANVAVCSDVSIAKTQPLSVILVTGP